MTFEIVRSYLHLQLLPLSSSNLTTSVPYLHRLQWHGQTAAFTVLCSQYWNQHWSSTKNQGPHTSKQTA